METANLLWRQRVRALLRVNAGAKKRFVGVYVAKAPNQALIEDHRLDLSRASAQALGEPSGGKLRGQWLDAELAFEPPYIVRVEMEDATEFALIGETEVESAVQFYRQVLEPQSIRLMRHHTKHAGHSQMDDDGGAIVEFQNEVFRAAMDIDNSMPDDTRLHIIEPLFAENAGEITQVDAFNAATDDRAEQGPADSFDFGEFWHTRAKGSPDGEAAVKVGAAYHAH
ncbi:MAG: hypothetical protein U0031_16155 [Thermomicrobiales bacterium]